MAMIARLTAFLVFCLMHSLFGAAFVAAQSADPVGVDVAVIDARIKRLMTEKGMVGLAVAIIEDGDLVHVKGYGETLAGSGDKVTDETVFRWASVSKGIASTLVAKLDEQGLLSLDDPAARHAKSLKLPNQGEQTARIEHVLSHQLGIIRNAYDNKLEAGTDPKVIRASLAGLSLACPVGTCHGYQNVAYDASSEIIATVTGKSYLEAATAYMFDPLGMTSVVMSAADLQHSSRWARPHNSAGYNVYRTMRESYFRVPAAGGMASNIRDLGLWMRAQMGMNSHVISDSVLIQTHSPRVATPREDTRVRRFYPLMEDAQYSLGWRVYDYAGRKVVGHRGAVNGYRALILFDPELKTGVAAMWNSGSNQPVGLQMEVMDMAYGLPRRDWLYLDNGPNLAAVKRLNSQISRIEPPENAPVPRLSPYDVYDGLPADHGAPLYWLDSCFSF